MEESNYLKNNEMIAHFMGLEGQHEEWCGNNILVDDEYSDTGKTMIPYTPESNWSQLMPVVEKIESLGYVFNISRKQCEIYYSQPTMDGVSWSKRSGHKIERVWELCLEFIIWHNTNQSK